MTSDQIAAMLRDVELVERTLPEDMRVSPIADVCCHVKALAALVKELRRAQFNAHEALELCERLAAAGYRLMQIAGGAEIECGDMQFACEDGMFSEEIACQRIRALRNAAKAVGQSKG